MLPSKSSLVQSSLNISALSRQRPVVQVWPIRSNVRPTTRSFSLIESSVAATNTILTSFHSFTGLPWYVTLPLTALAVRTTIVLPLNLVGQRNRQQRARLLPKVLEARPALEREVIAKYNALGPQECTRRLSQALSRKQKELATEAGIGSWQAWVPWAQFPVWLLVIETIRRMCGAGEGLLGIFSGSDTADRATRSSAVDASPSNAASFDPSELTAVSVSETARYNPLFEPSLSLEGCLWFPDLLVPDPQVILPFAVSGIMFTNIWWEERTLIKAGVARPRWSRGLTRGLKIVALAVGPLTLHIPAAVHLYWVASAGTALAQKGVADMIYPIPRPPPPPQAPEAANPISARPGPLATSSAPKRPYRPLRRPKR